MIKIKKFLKIIAAFCFCATSLFAADIGWDSIEELAKDPNNNGQSVYEVVDENKKVKYITSQQLQFIGSNVTYSNVGAIIDNGKYKENAKVHTATYKTIGEAAIAWAKEYNGESIKNNKEYASYIVKNSDGTYSFTIPTIGDQDSAERDWPLYVKDEKEDEKRVTLEDGAPVVVAGIHSHSDYGGLGSNYPSHIDVETSNNTKRDEYIACPNSALLRYEQNSGTPDNIDGWGVYFITYNSGISMSEKFLEEYKKKDKDDEISEDDIIDSVKLSGGAVANAIKSENEAGKKEPTSTGSFGKIEIVEEAFSIESLINPSASKKISGGFICRFAPDCTCGNGLCKCSDYKYNEVAGIIVGTKPYEIDNWGDFMEDMVGAGGKDIVDLITDLNLEKIQATLEKLKARNDLQDFEQAQAVADMLNAVTALIEKKNKGGEISPLDIVKFSATMFACGVSLDQDLMKELNLTKLSKNFGKFMKGVAKGCEIYEGAVDIIDNWDSMSKTDVLVEGTETILVVAGAKYKLAYEGGKLIAYSVTSAILNNMNKYSWKEIFETKSEMAKFLKIDSMSEKEREDINHAILTLFLPEIDPNLRQEKLAMLLKAAQNVGGTKGYNLMMSMAVNILVGGDTGYTGKILDQQRELMKNFDYSGAPNSCQCPDDCHCRIKHEQPDEGKEEDSQNKDDGQMNTPGEAPQTPSSGPSGQAPQTPSSGSSGETAQNPSDNTSGSGEYTVVDTSKVPNADIDSGMSILEEIATAKLPSSAVKIPDVPTGADAIKKQNSAKAPTKYKTLNLKQTDTAKLLNSGMNSGYVIKNSGDSKNSGYIEQVKENTKAARDSDGIDISSGL